jgi:hypothetical protein
MRREFISLLWLSAVRLRRSALLRLFRRTLLTGRADKREPISLANQDAVWLDSCKFATTFPSSNLTCHAVQSPPAQLPSERTALGQSDHALLRPFWHPVFVMLERDPTSMTGPQVRPTMRAFVLSSSHD